LVSGNWSQRLSATAPECGGERWLEDLRRRRRWTWHTRFLWTARTLMLRCSQPGDHCAQAEQPSKSYHGWRRLGRQERIVGTVTGFSRLPSDDVPVVRSTQRHAKRCTGQCRCADRRCDNEDSRRLCQRGACADGAVAAHDALVAGGAVERRRLALWRLAVPRLAPLAMACCINADSLAVCLVMLCAARSAVKAGGRVGQYPQVAGS
jgi:hypothetical protein